MSQILIKDEPTERAGKRQRYPLTSKFSQDKGENGIESGEKASKICKMALKCDTHTDIDCQFWCNSCMLSICAQCMCGYHREHDFKLLDVVLPEKIRESLRVLGNIACKTEMINNRIANYEDNIEFYSKQIEVYSRMKRECEKTRDSSLLYDEHEESLQNFADGFGTIKPDPEIVGSLLKVLNRNDEELLFKSNPTVMAFYKGPLWQSNTNRMKLEVKCDYCDLLLEGWRCQSTTECSLFIDCLSLRHPVSFDLRMTIVTEPIKKDNLQKSQVISKFFFDLKFNDAGFGSRELCGNHFINDRFTYPCDVNRDVKIYFEFLFHDSN